MSKSTYLLKLPTSVKRPAARLANAEGVSLNQFIASAVAEKVGLIETAPEFLEQRAGHAKPEDLLKYLRKAGPERSAESDRRWQLDEIRTGIKELDEGRGVPHTDVANWLRSWA
jgi:hypothetical protein